MIQYNNEDKTPDSKGWIISKNQLINIQDKVSEWEDCPSLELIETVILALNDETDLLFQWSIEEENLKNSEENK